jgi:anti-sigma factor RsiW
MSKHFSEADLLETYYTQPGESMPVMMHLADCEECAARYERLERKIRGAATTTCPHDEKPETFWTRQRFSILRRVEQQKKQRTSLSQTIRIAAAAALAFVLGGVAMYRTIEPATSTTHAVATIADTASTMKTTAAVTASTDTAVPADPWQSEELDEFQSMVNWESWGDPRS